MALVFLIELFLNRGQLPTFELTDFDRAPSVGSASRVRCEAGWSISTISRRLRVGARHCFT